jgi:hypothetical protein
MPTDFEPVSARKRAGASSSATRNHDALVLAYHLPRHGWVVVRSRWKVVPVVVVGASRLGYRIK